MPRWSIVLPVHNGSRYLEQAVRSTLFGMPRDAELRIADDGSTDATPAILASFAARDRRIILSHHKEALGVSATLNELIAMGDSPFVARMDADDISMPQRWRLGERLLHTSDYAFTSIIIVDSVGRPKRLEQPGHLSSESLPYHLLLGCCLVHPTAMFRREAFNLVGGYARTMAEDYDMWLRAVLAGSRLQRSATPGLLYRHHSQQLTAKNPWIDEGADTCLGDSYRELSQRLLSGTDGQFSTMLKAVLHGGHIEASDRSVVEGILTELDERARQLPTANDRALLRWRIRRTRRRLMREVDRQLA